jgi:ribosomal protein L14
VQKLRNKLKKLLKWKKGEVYRALIIRTKTKHRKKTALKFYSKEML